MISTFSRIVGLFLFALVIAPTNSSLAQQRDVNLDKRYNALAWMQNSAEYAQLCKQTYRMALTQLSVGLRDKKWSADEVQDFLGGFENKTPAVILDVDETVLDNSAFNARNILKGEAYKTETWNAWCEEGQADAIPGSLEFVKAAHAMGVKIFYVTNRRDVVKAATVKNLRRLGFPVSKSTMLTKNADKGRGDDKLTRRAMIAEKHRIILLIGDSMSDLCSGMDSDETEERNETARKKTDLLGTRWIVMPNPVYGGWERALPESKKALKPKLAD